MAHSLETDAQYSITVPVTAHPHITGYVDMDPWFQQPNDVMRGILIGAKTAREQAISYRNFTVGAFGVGLRQILSNGDHLYRTFHGGNEKPDAFGGINIHAEQEVIGAAEQHATTLTTMVLWGNNQPDQGTGVPFPAIVPCSAVCLPNLIASETIDKRRTLFASLSTDRKLVMLYTLPQLATAYVTRNPDMLYRTTYEPGLELYEANQTGEPIILADKPEEKTFDDWFTMHISRIVMEHIYVGLA